MIHFNCFTLWLTGLSGSGKTTISKELSKKIRDLGIHTCVIDGDELRSGLCSDLGFDAADRSENVRRAAHIAKILNANGIFSIVAMISPYISDRKSATDIIGSEKFFEIYISTPLHICENRDPKGLYAKARRNPSSQMTGLQSPYEKPCEPALTLDTSNKTPTSSTKELLEFFQSKI